jgi:hypothetical protein
LSPPRSGEGRAWFDRTAFIEWEDWQTGVANLEVEHPNNYRFVQIRTSNTAVSEVQVIHEEAVYATLTASVSGEPPEPRRACLTQNYPNPFNPATTIVLHTPAGEGLVQASLTVYDVRGRRIASLFDGTLPRGSRRAFAWDGRDSQGRDVPSGVYFSRTEIDGRAESRKMVLLR